MGLHPLQDYKERSCQDQYKKVEELVAFLQEPTRFSSFPVFFSLQITRQIAHKSTGSTASFEMYGKSNLIQILLVISMALLLWIVSPSPLSQWQVKSTAMVFSFKLQALSPCRRCPHSRHLFLCYRSTSCWSTMTFLPITPSCCKGKWNQWQWHFCLMSSCQCCPHSHHLFFIIDALVVDQQWHSFSDNSLLLQRQVESVAQRLLSACEVTTGPLVVMRSGCCCPKIMITLLLAFWLEFS
jgi:hypothetical protein